MSEIITSGGEAEGTYVYSPENVMEQSQRAPEHLGYKILKFFVDEDGGLAKHPTPTMATFYLSPSGGTLRDADLNIVLYSAKYDLYKGLGKQS